MNIIRVFHADHNVSEATMNWAIAQINPTGFFLRTLELPASHIDLTNNLYGPVAGDPPVVGEMLVRSETDEFRGATPFVDMPPRPTRLVTIIGMVVAEGVVVYTCYGGPAAERIPSDPSLDNDPAGRAIAETFWSQHALSIAARPID